MSCVTSECPVLLNSSCVFYEGANLAFTGIVTNDNVETVIQKINSKMSEDSGGTVTDVTTTLPLSSSGGTTPNISISLATAGQSGYLSSTDWNNFNNKQNIVSLTTLGTSGASTFIANVLNIPQYQAAGTYVNSVSGTTDRITSTGGVTPIIDIAATYIGQASITTLGTITIGVWTGTDIAFANIAQGTARSVIGVTGNATADIAPIQGTTDQILRINGAGTDLAFGSIDLSKSAAVGTSILGIANGGTGSATFTGYLLASGGTATGPNTFTGTTTNIFKYVFAGLAATLVNGAGHWLANTTAAIAGTQQISPSIVLEGQGWKTDTGGESRSVKFAQYVVPIQGAANPTGILRISSSINNVAYTDILSISETGFITSASGAIFGNSVGIIGTNNTLSNSSGANATGVKISVSGTSSTAGITVTGYEYSFATNSATSNLTGYRLNSTITSVLDVTGFFYDPINPSNILGKNIAFHSTSGSIVFGHTTVTSVTTRMQIRGIGNGTNTLSLFESLDGTPRTTMLDNGSIGLFGAITFDTGVGVLALKNATTAPAAGDADETIIYSKDVSASSELFVMNEAGVETQLSTNTIAAPSTSVGAAIVNYYGTAATNFLGDPVAWMTKKIGATTYKVPLY